MDLKKCDYCKKVEELGMTGAWGKVVFKDPERVVDGRHNEIYFDVCPSCLKELYWDMYKGRKTDECQ